MGPSGMTPEQNFCTMAPGIAADTGPGIVFPLEFVHHSFIVPTIAGWRRRLMPLCVVGSVALDCVETPTERRENLLGGSAVFFAYAASFFTTVRLAGVVGEDWPPEYTELLRSRGIDISALQCIPGGKTFRWRGRYLPNMNERETLDLQLNVLDNFQPVLPESYRCAEVLFLANGSPKLQLQTLEQCPKARLVVADTMDHYIRNERDGLLDLLRRIDGLVLNDSEAKLLAEDSNLIRAGDALRRLGPKFVVIKKGEHGAIFFAPDGVFALPAYPTPHVVDPTGAGDSFAGGMLGYLAQCDRPKPNDFKLALAYGILVAGFSVEDFSLERLRTITRADIENRLEEYRRMLHLSP